MIIKVITGVSIAGLNIIPLENAPYVEIISGEKELVQNVDYTVEDINRPGYELHLPSLGFPVFFQDKR